MTMVSESLRHLFNPESIAVIGASTTRGKVGNAILRNLILYGYKGDIYPVNPKYSEVEGLRCYFSVKDIEKPPHLAIICVPASAVLGTV
ncbi:MAG: CoA-binding protein, partial [Candidatus Methanoplasma sp.]|nr:CoA-binding protein [Candidatus Methanoplasma sp.]